MSGSSFILILLILNVFVTHKISDRSKKKKRTHFSLVQGWFQKHIGKKIVIFGQVWFAWITSSQNTCLYNFQKSHVVMYMDFNSFWHQDKHHLINNFCTVFKNTLVFLSVPATKVKHFLSLCCLFIFFYFYEIFGGRFHVSFGILFLKVMCMSLHIWEACCLPIHHKCFSPIDFNL